MYFSLPHPISGLQQCQILLLFFNCSQSLKLARVYKLQPILCSQSTQWNSVGVCYVQVMNRGLLYNDSVMVLSYDDVHVSVIAHICAYMWFVQYMLSFDAAYNPL